MVPQWIRLDYLGYAVDKYDLNTNNFFAGMEKNTVHPRDPGGASCSQDLWIDKTPMLPYGMKCCQ